MRSIKFWLLPWTSYSPSPLWCTSKQWRCKSDIWNKYNSGGWMIGRAGQVQSSRSLVNAVEAFARDTSYWVLYLYKMTTCFPYHVFALDVLNWDICQYWGGCIIDYNISCSIIRWMTNRRVEMKQRERNGVCVCVWSSVGCQIWDIIIGLAGVCVPSAPTLLSWIFCLYIRSDW
jgi:hypothetical protein